MPAFTNLLPDTKSAKCRGYKFVPTCYGCGTLTYQAKGEVSRYAVSEFPADLPGRAFAVRKADGETYDVLVADRPQNDLCDCRGFARYGRCKHLDVLRDLLAHDQLPAPTETDADPVNPDADVANTETDAGFDDWCDRQETATQHIARIRRQWAERGYEPAA